MIFPWEQLIQARPPMNTLSPISIVEYEKLEFSGSNATHLPQAANDGLQIFCPIVRMTLCRNLIVLCMGFMGFNNVYFLELFRWLFFAARAIFVKQTRPQLRSRIRDNSDLPLSC